ncbi:hypothetical protein FHW36_104344 [Chitinophaga polysaccharea]|uniref:Uncharacterized protein n=1 Tax=Chitinophaga polysaccharea TaxID=1293035 RepID=A0A561PRE3_9BACT|nr:hypothetical protein FHW36_104344 [Chitinophaga polysaccharea]
MLTGRCFLSPIATGMGGTYLAAETILSRVTSMKHTCFRQGNAGAYVVISIAVLWGKHFYAQHIVQMKLSSYEW